MTAISPELHLKTQQHLIEAIKHGDFIKVNNLVSNGISVYNPNYLNCPIFHSITNGHTKIFNFLIKKHAAVSVLNPNVLKEAIEKGNFDVIKELSSQGMDASPFAKEGIMQSIHHWHLPMLKFFMQYDITQDIKNAALLQSCLHSQFDLASYLLENGSDVHFNDNHIMKEVATSGNLQSVKYLMEKNGDISLAKEYGNEKIKSWATNWKVVKRFKM